VQSKLFNYMGLVLVAIIWGINFGFSRMEMANFDPQLFTFLRFGLAVPCFFILLRFKEGSVGIPFKVALKLMVIGFFGVTVLEITTIYSIKYTSLANASLLNVAPWPIFAALLAPFFTRESITVRVAVGGGIAMVGVCIIILTGGEGFGMSSSQVAGNLLAFSTSIIGALYNLSCMPLMKRYSALRISTWFIMFGALFMFPLTLGSWGKVAWSALATTDYLVLAYNVIFATVIAFVVWNACMHHIGAARSNFFRYVVPAAAVSVGYIMFGERITLWQIAGALFMAAGLIWISMERKSQATKRHMQELYGRQR
jgi:drug/metabolite transporter (DMT)-like permease